MVHLSRRRLRQNQQTHQYTRTHHVCGQHSQCVQCHQCPTSLATQFIGTDLSMCVVTNANTLLNMSSDTGVLHPLRTCPRNEICD